MLPQLPAVHLVGDAASPRAAAARTASAAVQPGALVRQSSSIAVAIAAPVDGPEVLVLLNASPEDFKIAMAALDPRGLPRWAVVPPGPEDLPRADLVAEGWEVPVLARSMAFAVSLLVLRRSNARLSGDLHTVGRRLAHDLRTPLNSISTANEALAVLAPAAEPASTLHRAIAVAVDEMGGLLERVGTVLIASARPLDRQPVDMEEIVWRAREKLDARLRLAGASILSPEKWPVVSGVASWLEVVWTNLLANSVQHGGSAPHIELGWTRSDALARFWVRDSGPGVALAKRARLFHSLDRLNELNAPRGYGLSLVQRLIELQGGTTSYSPDPMPGGTFSFTLPDSA
jgi:signal transduction histidine kinase